MGILVVTAILQAFISRLLSMKYPVLSILAFSLLVQGCVIATGSGSDESEELIFDEPSKEEMIDSKNKYKLSLMGSSNKITLQGNIHELFISGSHNYVVIEEDTYLESLIITGLHNIVVQEDDLKTLIEVIEIVGDNNFVDVSQYNELVDAGSDNQILITDSNAL